MRKFSHLHIPLSLTLKKSLYLKRQTCCTIDYVSYPCSAHSGVILVESKSFGPSSRPLHSSQFNHFNKQKPSINLFGEASDYTTSPAAPLRRISRDVRPPQDPCRASEMSLHSPQPSGPGSSGPVSFQYYASSRRTNTINPCLPKHLFRVIVTWPLLCCTEYVLVVVVRRGLHPVAPCKSTRNSECIQPYSRGTTSLTLHRQNIK